MNPPMNVPWMPGPVTSCPASNKPCTGVRTLSTRVPIRFQTAELSVLFEHEDAAAALGKRRGRGQATDAGTNDYRIEGSSVSGHVLFFRTQSSKPC